MSKGKDYRQKLLQVKEVEIDKQARTIRGRQSNFTVLAVCTGIRQKPVFRRVKKKKTI